MLKYTTTYEVVNPKLLFIIFTPSPTTERIAKMTYRLLCDIVLLLYVLLPLDRVTYLYYI
jgi:hypothetical protein